jgi:hypothetical protein
LNSAKMSFGASPKNDTTTEVEITNLIGCWKVPKANVFPGRWISLICVDFSEFYPCHKNHPVFKIPAFEIRHLVPINIGLQ